VSICHGTIGSGGGVSARQNLIGIRHEMKFRTTGFEYASHRHQGFFDPFQAQDLVQWADVE